MENNYVAIIETDKHISISFYVENKEILTIGEKMNEINEEAYMNGYNWEAFFNYYLAKNAPDVLDGMESDPEAGMYSAYYQKTPENKLKAEKFMKIICSLVDGEEELYRIVKEEGDEIEWD